MRLLENNKSANLPLSFWRAGLFFHGTAVQNHRQHLLIAKMKEGDWLIYYSPRDAYPDGKLLRSFTAIGKVKSGNIYPYQMAPNFIPYRLDIDYYPCHKIGFYDIKSQLEFVLETKHLGFLFRRGHFEPIACAIVKKSFLLISKCPLRNKKPRCLVSRTNSSCDLMS